MQDFFACIAAILLKKKCEYCTIHFNMGSKPCHHNHSNKMKSHKEKKKEMDQNPRIAIQRLYLLNP